MSESEKMPKLYEKFGVYVHVPFCAKPCGYCRFYKKIPSPQDAEFYLRALETEVGLFFAETPDAPRPDTMFWGGGTPSVLSPEQITRAAEILGRLKPAQEWTVEVSPSSIDAERLDALKQAGATRISLGVQSFSEKTLRELGRAHTLEATLSSIELVKNAGFGHFSIDLIFGSKTQTAEDFAADLERAAACGVDHISAYCLEFESGTSACAGLKTDAQLEKNATDAGLFELAMRRLPQLGFAQYEISNYAKSESARCAHNLSTWAMAQWVGFGPSAASQFGGFRYRNKPNMAEWANAMQCGRHAREDIVPLDDAEMFSSALIFGLRTNAGVDFPTLKTRFPSADAEKYEEPIRRLCAQNLLERDDGTLRLTFEGRLLADYVAVELL